MQLASEIKNDVKADLKVAKKMRLRWRGLLCVFIGTLLVAWAFDHFGRFDLTRPALVSAGAIAFAIAIKWDLRRRAWFWIAIFILAALHVALLASVPWADKWVPAAVSAGVCTIDVFVMLAIIDAIEICVERRERRTNSLPLT